MHKLMMLAQSSRLRLIIAKHRTVEIIHLGRLRVVEEVVFYEHAGRAGSTLGLEGYGPAALVIKGVHFLLHYIRGIAHSPKEQLGMLNDGGAYLAEPEVVAGLPCDLLNILPLIAFSRRNVLSALRRLNCHDLSSHSILIIKRSPARQRDGRPAVPP